MSDGNDLIGALRLLTARVSNSHPGSPDSVSRSDFFII